jgi:hypothetical protein
MSKDEIRYMNALEKVLLVALDILPYAECRADKKFIPKIKRLEAAALKAAKLRALLPD